MATRVAVVNKPIALVALASALFMAGSRVGAQLPAPQQPRFTVRTDAVQVDVLVTHKGRTVTGLTADDFEVRDEGVLQRVEVVAAETSPLNVIYVVSVGGGAKFVRERLENTVRILVRAVEGSLQTLRPDDRVAFLSFYSNVRLLSPLVRDRAAIRDVFRWLQPVGVQSAFRDAAFSALAMRESEPGRTVLLLFGNGRDDNSWMTPQRLVEAAQRTDATVYAVTTRFRGITPFDYNPILDVLTQETGGRVLVAAAEADLVRAFSDILAECRGRYVLTYAPTGVQRGGWHRLHVSLKRKPGKVVARRGYFSG